MVGLQTPPSKTQASSNLQPSLFAQTEICAILCCTVQAGIQNPRLSTTDSHHAIFADDGLQRRNPTSFKDQVNLHKARPGKVAAARCSTSHTVHPGYGSGPYIVRCSLINPILCGSCCFLLALYRIENIEGGQSTVRTSPASCRSDVYDVLLTRYM